MNKQLVKIVSDIFELNEVEVDPDFSRATCSKWDSLMHLVLIAEIEHSFNVTLSPESIEKIQSLSDIEVLLAQNQAD